MEYSFKAYGHPNIRAEHVKTLEFTKDSELTERGDCIIGIRADFDASELKKFAKKVRFECSVVDPETDEKIVSVFKCKVNPEFNSDHEVVLRKSGFQSERTYGLGLNRGANNLDRRMVEVLQSPEAVMLITVKSGWAD